MEDVNNTNRDAAESRKGDAKESGPTNGRPSAEQLEQLQERVGGYLKEMLKVIINPRRWKDPLRPARPPEDQEGPRKRDKFEDRIPGWTPMEDAVGKFADASYEPHSNNADEQPTPPAVPVARKGKER